MSDSLPDLLATKLDVVFVGINPAWYSVRRGHYFARATNRFWQAFSSSILSTPARESLGTQRLLPEHDRLLTQFGFGFTDLIKRPTVAARELTQPEFRQGISDLKEKMERYEPRIACFQGISAYRRIRRLMGDPRDSVELGAQVPRLGRTLIYLVPNPSGANAHVTRHQQAGWYDELAKVLSALKGSHSARRG